MSENLGSPNEQVIKNLHNFLEPQFGKTVKREDKDKVRKIVDAQKRIKESNFYQKKHDIEILGASMGDILSFENDPESKAEGIFYFLLKENHIRFKFQYKIGKYRVDYLVQDCLAVELDGPHHDNTMKYDQERDDYIRKMGYEVLRIPIWLVSMDEKAVMKEIKRKVREIELGLKV